MHPEDFEAIVDAAATGRIGRRSVMRLLGAAGAGMLMSHPTLSRAITSGENQNRKRRALSRRYDYIVVGGGSAGCVVAARLAQDPDAQVLLIEAGGADDGKASLSDPTAWFTNIGGPLDWNLFYEPHSRLENRQILISRGKVLGGCGSTNAMLWVRGHPGDYDRWSELGATGWDYASTLPYFKMIEDWEGGETALRGSGGPIPIERPKNPHAISVALLEASRSMGYAVVEDVNGPVFGGASLANLNIRNGARVSTARGYLRPMLGQSNLTVLTDSTVLRLVTQGTRANAVEHLVDGNQITTQARQEVVLCAGAIATPRLLMLSGIGPADHLKAHGIAPLHDHVELGQNLKDHPLLMGVNFHYRDAAPPLCDNSGGAQLIAASAPDKAVPDLMIITIQVPYASPEVQSQFGAIGSGFAITPGLMRVESKGYVALRSADPLAVPLIAPNLLGTDTDMAAMMRGVELCQELGAQPAYSVMCRPAAPDRRLDRAELAAFVRASCATFFHPVGTCRMGTDTAAVVDPKSLKLHGMDNLRIIDASVMPEIPTCNTHAATVMIAERGAAMIRAETA